MTFQSVKTYLFVPQWQDSGGTKELHDGAIALRDYCRTLSKQAFAEVPVSLSGGLGIVQNIYGYAVIREQLKRISGILEEQKAQRIFTLGGGCGIALPIVSHLSRRHPGLQVFWFDAHGDLNSPQSSPSKHFHGMPLRFLTEPQPEYDIGRIFSRITPQALTLIGTRDLDPPEREYIGRQRIRVISKEDPVTDLDGVLKQALKTGSGTAAYVHVDLDVIDPGQYRNVKCPASNGLTIAEVIRLIKSIKSERTLTGLSILENTETDLEKIGRLKELFLTGLGL